MSEPEPATVKAWLEGDVHDLQVLAQLLAEGGTRVVRDPDKDAYYLTAIEIDDSRSGTALYEVAKKRITFVNGYGCVEETGFRPVKLSGEFSEGDSEHRVIFVESTEEVRVPTDVHTVTVTGEGGTVVSLPPPLPPPPWPDRFALADKHPDVAEVFELMSQPPGWVELYKVHEKIEESISGSIPKMGWASEPGDNAFRSSANRREISGRGARHARRGKRPLPKRTMTIQQGHDYIRGIVINWLEWLRKQP